MLVLTNYCPVMLVSNALNFMNIPVVMMIGPLGVGDTAVRSSYLYFLIWYTRTIRYMFASHTSFSLQSITFNWR